MHEFVILALGGALTLKTLDFLRSFTGDMHGAVSAVFGAAVGIFYAYLFNYSMFAAWGIDVRSETIGMVGTGLFMWAMADVWRETVNLVHEWAHRYRGEAVAAEHRIRAA